MTRREDTPDPDQIHTLDDLTVAFTRLRRLAARPGQVQLSVRDVATRSGRPPSTIDPYLRGKRLCPVDVYEDVLRAVGVPADQLRPWLNAWERIADRGRAPVPAAAGPSRSGLLPYTEILLYRPGWSSADPEARIGLFCGDVRRVRCADLWVNSENTEMRMARFEEYSMSAIVRFEGAVRDRAGRVVEDRVADELERLVGDRRPVSPGTAVSTGAGGLEQRNGVRFVIHVAAVYGEPGEGYRPVADIGGCTTNALAEAERLALGNPVSSILFPLLGAGVGGGDPAPSARAIVGAAIDHLGGMRDGRIRTIYLLASTAGEREVCQAVLAAAPLVPLG